MILADGVPAGAACDRSQPGWLGRYVPCARNTEVVVENVVPVVLDFVATEGENKAGFRLDDEEVSYIERLNLLRFT